jgi:hypothetical protein
MEEKIVEFQREQAIFCAQYRSEEPAVEEVDYQNHQLIAQIERNSPDPCSESAIEGVQ